MGHNGLHGEGVAAPSYSRAGAGVCAIFAVSVVCTTQMSWAPVHAGVYIPQMFLISDLIIHFGLGPMDGAHTNADDQILIWPEQF